MTLTELQAIPCLSDPVERDPIYHNGENEHDRSDRFLILPSSVVHEQPNSGEKLLSGRLFGFSQDILSTLGGW